MKLGHILATASWTSTFVLIWLTIAKVVEGREVIGFLIFFFCLAVVVSAVTAQRGDGKGDKGSKGDGRE